MTWESLENYLESLDSHLGLHMLEHPLLGLHSDFTFEIKLCWGMRASVYDIYFYVLIFSGYWTWEVEGEKSSCFCEECNLEDFFQGSAEKNDVNGQWKRKGMEPPEHSDLPNYSTCCRGKLWRNNGSWCQKGNAVVLKVRQLSKRLILNAAVCPFWFDCSRIDLSIWFVFVIGFGFVFASVVFVSP